MRGGGGKTNRYRALMPGVGIAARIRSAKRKVVAAAGIACAVFCAYADREVGPVAYPRTQWGRIAYGNRSAMSGTAWMDIALQNYVFKGAGATSNLNGWQTTWQTTNLQKSQLRFDGWFEVTADKAGDWRFQMAYDDYFAFYIDDARILYINTAQKTDPSETVNLTEGWHRFTVICGDTTGGYGAGWVSLLGDNTNRALVASNVTTSARYDFLADSAAFPQGSGENRFTLAENADWSADGTTMLTSGAILDLNGRTLTVSDIDCDNYIGAMVTNSAATKAVLLFLGDPDESTAVAKNLVKGAGDNIILANKDALSAMWTGGAGNGLATDAGNWRNVLTGEAMVPTADCDAVVSGTVDLQIPSGSAFVCKSFSIQNCTLATDCDWSGLSVRPALGGTANLNGHTLTLGKLTAVSGAAISGGDGSALVFVLDDTSYSGAFNEAAFIDGVANLAVSGSAKIQFPKSGNGTTTINQLQLGASASPVELAQTGGAVVLGAKIHGIGEASGKKGVYTMTGGTLSTPAGSEFQVGRYGQGEFVQTSGDVTIGEWLSIARLANSRGIYTITGGTLTAVKSGRPVWIGGDTGAEGVLNVGGDAVLHLNAVALGGNDKKTATAKVNIGGNAKITVDDYFQTSSYNATNYKTTFTVTQDGGELSVGGFMRLPSYGGSGSFVQTRGKTTTGNSVLIGCGQRNADATGVLDVGGTFTAGGSGIWLGYGANAKGSLVLREGGTLVAKCIQRNEGTAHVTFAGGKAVATADNANFITKIDDLTFAKGGVEIDSAGRSVGMTLCTVDTVAGSSLKKSGNGTLALEALPPVDTVAVDGGTLALSSGGDLASASVAHRWSFSGDLRDSVTGKTATKYGSGAISYPDSSSLLLPGGSKGTCYVDLGADKFAGESVTIEMWVTLRTTRDWTRIFVIGGASGSWTVCNSRRASGEGNVFNFDSFNGTQKGDKSLAKDVKYHIAVTYAPDGAGGIVERQYVTKADGESVWTGEVKKSGWAVSANAAQDYFWLGHSNGNDPDTNAEYDEIRVWTGALGAEAIAASVKKGPDATAEDLAAIAAADSGASAVSARSLAIAPGAALAVGTGNTLKVANLGIAGTLASGNLVVEGRAVATAGEKMTVASGATLDLTGAEICIANPEDIASDGFTIAESSAGGIVPAAPRKLEGALSGYFLFLTPGKARIGKQGFSVIIR